MPSAQLSFTEQVWQAARKIPRGKVSTYQLIARAIGRPRAYRAVGTALGHNPDLGFTPCYRVVCSDGRVGQYGGGQKKKIELLRRDGIEITPEKRIGNLKKHLHIFK